MKKFQFFVVCLLMVTFTATSVMAAGGNWKKGKKVYKDTCQTCHERGGEGGLLKPAKKTIAQWQRFFDKEKHAAKPEVWNKLSEKDLANLLEYFKKYAADANQAQTCG